MKKTVFALTAGAILLGAGAAGAQPYYYNHDRNYDRSYDHRWDRDRDHDRGYHNGYWNGRHYGWRNRHYNYWGATPYARKTCDWRYGRYVCWYVR
jgi:hypothetical protein